MDLGRAGVWSTVGIIVGVMVLSGPMVGAVDLTPAPPESTPGDGNVSLSVVSVPSDGIRLDRGKYGSGVYVLRVPDAEVHVRSIRGSPIVVYKIRIPELGYARASIHVLEEGQDGQREKLEIDEDEIDPGRVTRKVYGGELLVVVRGSDGSSIPHRSNVTVEVSG